MMQGEISIPVSISYGVASITDPGVADPVSLLRTADAMLYSIKKSRKTT
jgi:PleD family two-component response regulator